MLYLSPKEKKYIQFPILTPVLLKPHTASLHILARKEKIKDEK
jgi:hypothetical protein